MVKLRFSRFGRKGEPTYRVIAVDSHNKRDGRAIEELGYYIPATKKLELKKDRVQYWVSVGAQPTDTVARLLAKEGLWEKKSLPTTKYNVKPGQKSLDRAEAKASKLEAAKQAKEEAKAAAKAEKEAAAAQPEEAPAVEETIAEVTAEQIEQEIVDQPANTESEGA